MTGHVTHSENGALNEAISHEHKHSESLHRRPGKRTAQDVLLEDDIIALSHCTVMNTQAASSGDQKFWERNVGNHDLDFKLTVVNQHKSSAAVDSKHFRGEEDGVPSVKAIGVFKRSLSAPPPSTAKSKNIMCNQSGAERQPFVPVNNNGDSRVAHLCTSSLTTRSAVARHCGRKVMKDKSHDGTGPQIGFESESSNRTVSRFQQQYLARMGGGTGKISYDRTALLAKRVYGSSGRSFRPLVFFLSWPIVVFAVAHADKHVLHHF